jgi:hypothetical protein
MHFLFSQEYEHSFFKYNLYTELSYILKNEGEPYLKDPNYNTYFYINKIMNNFLIHYRYTFFDDKLQETHIEFVIDKNETTEYYNDVFYQIINYYNNKYSVESSIEIEYLDELIVFSVLWDGDDDSFIFLQKGVSRDNNINKFLFIKNVAF